MAKEAEVSQSTMQRVVTKDLGIVSRAIVRTQPLTAHHRQMRVERYKKMLNFLKLNPCLPFSLVMRIIRALICL